MTRNQKNSMVALVLLFLFGTAFGGEPVEPAEPKIPPKPDEPCPDGFHYKLDRATLTWECVPNTPGEPGEPTGPTPGTIEKPEVPETPPENPADWIKPYPTGDSFYQVMIGDQFFGVGGSSITWRYLATEAFLAAQADGLSTNDANAFAKKVADNSDNRVDALNIICCSPINDACYGTWGYNPDKDPMPAKNGRVIRLNPQNHDNAARLLAGNNMARCVKVGSPQAKGDKSGVRVDNSCGSYELLWLPRLDWAKIRATAAANGRAKIEPAPLEWENGDPHMVPPPFITDRGVAFSNGSNTAGVSVWGCVGIFTMELGE